MDSELPAYELVEQPGSSPLRNIKHERFAVARAAMFGLLEAARAAGYPAMTAGNAAKIDRMPRVRERIRFLSRDTPEIVQTVRAKVATKLNVIGDGSMADFIRLERDPAAVAAIQKTVNDALECERAIAALPILPYLDLTRVAALAPEEQREILSVVKSIAYTDNGPKVELHSPLDAAAQLRALHGLDVPKLDKMALTDPSGRHSFAVTADVYKLTDAQLLALSAGAGRPTIRLTGRPADYDKRQPVENRSAEDKPEQE
jgi:hypothetical protein